MLARPYQVFGHDSYRFHLILSSCLFNLHGQLLFFSLQPRFFPIELPHRPRDHAFVFSQDFLERFILSKYISHDCATKGGLSLRLEFAVWLGFFFVTGVLCFRRSWMSRALCPDPPLEWHTLVCRRRTTMIQRARLLLLRPRSIFTATRKSSSSSLFSLEGRSAIVTGGGTGIGKALANGLAQAGASVVLVGRRKPVLDAAVAEIEGSAYAIACDITDTCALDGLVHEAARQTGIPPSIVIHNAGINVRQPAQDLTEDHWKTSLDLMLTAPFFLTRALIPHMQDQNYGRILSIASLQSYRAFPDSIPYAAAKSGTLGLTRALAEAYGKTQNITCNAIAPGYVKTELTKSVFSDPERSQRLADATILGRNSVPEDLVGAAVFLCSPASAYITGQTLAVDGGFTALGLR